MGLADSAALTPLSLQLGLTLEFLSSPGHGLHEKGEEPPALSQPRGQGWKSPTSYLGRLRKQPPGRGPPPARDFSPGGDTAYRAAAGTPAALQPAWGEGSSTQDHSLPCGKHGSQRS